MKLGLLTAAFPEPLTSTSACWLARSDPAYSPDPVIVTC